jgi:hypothetical protein
MKIRIKPVLSCIGCCTILFVATCNYSNATPLTPGNTISAPGESDPTGTLTTLDTISNSFATSSFSGAVVSTVYSGDTSNPYGSGDLTFTYELLLFSGPDSASAISIGSFANFLTDVSYQTPAIGLAPGSISRNPSGSQAVRFDFTGSGYLTPGHNSALLVVQTDAGAWTYGNATVLDSTGSPSILILAPVPEPSSLGLAGLGLAALAGYRRWKK